MSNPSFAPKFALAITLFFGISVSTATHAIAQTVPGATIDQRQANQQGRIAQGVTSGQLTPREATRLQQREGNIQRMEDRARADGTVTKKEAGAISKKQNSASQAIYRQKHDAQRDLNHDRVKDKRGVR